MAASNIFEFSGVKKPISSWGKFSLTTPWTPPTELGRIVPTGSVQTISVDSSTQTEEYRPQFRISPQLLKSKITAVLALHKYINKTIDIENIGILALIKCADEDQLKSTDLKKSAEVLFVKTIHHLINETESTPERLIITLQKDVKENDLLVYALNLVKNNGGLDALCSSSRNSAFLGAYCFALDCFLKHDGKPLEALEAARKAPFSVNTVMDLVTSMVGASYGSDFVPQHILSQPEIEVAYRKIN